MLDTVGFSKEYLPYNLFEFSKHIRKIGGEMSSLDRGEELLKYLFGIQHAAMQELYPFVFFPKEDSGIVCEPYIVGGYTPCGRAHLGSWLHIHSINSARNVVSKTISFNDLDSKNSIRCVPAEVEEDAICSFRLICNESVHFEKRTSHVPTMRLFLKFNSEIPEGDYNLILSRDTTKDERESLNIQAAAYLWPQFENRNRIVIGFDAIEEASRVSWINHVAALYNLRGFVNFISFQTPGYQSNLKMGKSNPNGSLLVGDSLVKVIERISSMPLDTKSLTIFAIIEFTFGNNLPKNSVHFLQKDNRIRITFEGQQRGLFLDNTVTFEDWVIVINRARTHSVLNPNIFLSSNFESLLCSPDRNISFTQILTYARFFAEHSRIINETDTKKVIEIPFQEFTILTKLHKEVSNGAYDFFNFLNTASKERVIKWRSAAISSLETCSPNVFPLS